MYDDEPLQTQPEEQKRRAALVVDDFNPFCKLIGQALEERGLEVLYATSAAKARTVFEEHRLEIDLVTIDLVTPSPGIADLGMEFERLQPGVPVLYLVGSRRSDTRCGIEASAPGSVLVVPFTKELLLARIGMLLASKPNDGLWTRLIERSDQMPARPALLYIYNLYQAVLASCHMATLRSKGIHCACRPTNYGSFPYSLVVNWQRVEQARHAIVTAGRRHRHSSAA